MKKIGILILLAVLLTGCNNLVSNDSSENSNQTQENESSNNESNNSSNLLLSNFTIYKTNGINSDINQKEVFTNHDIILITNEDQKEQTINSYVDDYNGDVASLTETVIGNNLNFFNESAIVVVPFVHSSSETDIDLQSLTFYVENSKFELLFNLFSPEYLDMDLQVTFFVIKIPLLELELVDKDLAQGYISVLNTRDDSSRSLYYPLTNLNTN